MFGDQFYPTPKEVIKKMLSHYKGKTHVGNIYGYEKDTIIAKLEGKTILEPSAGKGDILDFINNELYSYDRSNINFYCIEKDENLKAILREKEYDVIDSDFLTYTPDMFFDVILMNPPFKDGAKHLLKAIEISHDTDIVCLLNAETLLNPYTRERQKLLDLINENGSFEILGNVFETAERKTDVNVAMVKVHIKRDTGNFDFGFKSEKKESVQFDESFVKNELVRNDLIGNLMIQFDRAKEAYKEYIEAHEKARYFFNFINEEYFNFSDVDDIGLTPIKRYNRFNQKIKMKLWRKVINEIGMERYMTQKVRDNFNLFVQQQGNMTFNKENVNQLINMLVVNSGTILDNAIIDVFDMLTSNYYRENRMYVDGWKTNDRYKVNRKIIAPIYVRYGEYLNSYDLKEYGDKFSVSWAGETKYTDIDKVMCYISGKKYEDITTIMGALNKKFDQLGRIKTGQKFDNNCQSTFFDIKFHKKGTVHLTFRDKWLWQEFNMRACSNKNWLPDNERTEWERKRRKTQENKPQQQEKVLELEYKETLF